MVILLAVAAAAELSGQVRERGTGDALPGSLIRVEGQELTADADGRWAVELPGDGPWTVVILGPEHEELVVSADPSEPLLVFVRRAPPPPVIVVEAERVEPHHSAQVLDRERITKAPGTHDDPVRLLQSMPGVAQTPEYSPTAGELAVRGSATGESRYYLDGVEVPYLFHFHQYSSVFHARLLDELAFYPSTFGAPYGNATGAVVEARSRQPDPVRLHGGVHWNFVMAGGWVTAPVGENGGVSVSARRSYQDLKGTNDQYTFWPRFWDYLARYDHDLGQHHIALTVFGAGDGYGRYIGDTQELNPLEAESAGDFRYDRDFHAAAFRLENSLDGAELRTSVALVQDTWGGSIGPSSQTRLHRYTWLRHDAMVTLGTHALSMGLEVKPERLNLLTDSTSVLPDVAKEAPLLASGMPTDEQIDRLLAGVYAEGTVRAGSWTVRPGVRGQWDTITGQPGIDPRLSARWEGDHLRFRAGAGRYSMSPRLDAFSTTLGEPDLGLAISDQASVGVDLILAGRWELGIEGWGKSFEDVVVQDVGEPARAVSGSAWGVEFTHRYRLKDHFFSWASVTVGRAVREDAPFDFDQPFAVNVVGSWDFRPLWNVGARYRYATGLPYTPVEGGLYNATTDSYDALRGQTNSARLPSYQKFDVHLERTLELRRWSLVAYCELWWVPEKNNVMYLAYSYDWSETATVAGPGFMPLLGLRAEI